MAGGQWIIAGDFNLTPEELAESGWLERLRGAVLSRTTTGQPVEGRDIDFFVVPRDTVGRYGELGRVTSGIPTHSVIGVTARGGDLGTITELRMPRRFPEVSKEVEWRREHPQGTVEARWDRWCGRAEAHLAEATGVAEDRSYRGRGLGPRPRKTDLVRKLEAKRKGEGHKGGGLDTWPGKVLRCLQGWRPRREVGGTDRDDALRAALDGRGHGEHED